MKRKTLILPLLLTLASSPLFAGPGHRDHGNYRGHDNTVVKAKVSRVEPLIEVIRIPDEQRECWNEEVSGSRVHRSSDGLLVGAIIGGVVGHNIGNKRNRGATAAMGTLIGATIGHDSDRSTQSPYGYTEQRCRVTTHYTEEERINGYRVSYQFQGETYVTQMDHKPGRYVRLRVSHQLLD